MKIFLDKRMKEESRGREEVDGRGRRGVSDLYQCRQSLVQEFLSLANNVAVQRFLSMLRVSLCSCEGGEIEKEVNECVSEVPKDKTKGG